MKRLIRLLRRKEPERPTLTQREIDGAGEHRQRFNWTISQMRNTVFSGGYIKSQARDEFVIAEALR